MTADGSMSQQIKIVLARYLKRDPDTILPEHNLREDVGLDSLMTFELLYDLEKTFDLEIPNEDLPGLQTIADVVTYLESRISVEDLQKALAPSTGTAGSSGGQAPPPSSPEAKQGEKTTIKKKGASKPKTPAKAPKPKPKTAPKIVGAKKPAKKKTLKKK